MPSLKARARAFLRSAAEEALGTHIRQLSEGGKEAINTARILSILNESRELPHLRDYGFRTFSQFGEDGVIQRLISRVPDLDQRFVEIGVEDYSESNTRLLAEKDNWRGLIIDSGDEARGFLQRTGLGMMRSVDFCQSYVTAENVNDVLRGQPDDLGLLSIDIDGMDYWIWRAIETVRPAIVAIEYQSNFGPTEAIVVPYQPDFSHSRAHHSHLFWGASLAAMESLGSEKGYALVGTSDGPNAFFVREDRLGPLRRVTAEACYYETRYRESRDADGQPTYLTEMADRRREIADCEVLDLHTGERRKIGSYASLVPTP